MVSRAKSINLFLMDGDPGGRIKCTLANWTGVSYKIPRIHLDMCRDRIDFSHSGVYFLFGTCNDSSEDMVYIGQAGVRKNREGILHRLFEHKKNIEMDYWTEAVILTTSNNSFGPTEISYLESKFCNLALKSKRYVVRNSNEPNSGNVTEEKESELEEFIDYSKLVIGTLGYKLFESMEVKDDLKLLFINRRGTNAKLKLTSEGIVVLSGSLLSRDFTSSCPESAKGMRRKNKDYIDENFILHRDILFKSPSGAAAFVLGSSANGNYELKNKDGKSLKDIEDVVL